MSLVRKLRPIASFRLVIQSYHFLMDTRASDAWLRPSQTP